MRSSASSEPALQTPYAAGLTTFAFIQSRQGICALSNLCVQHRATYSRLTGDGAQSGNPAVAKIAQSAKYPLQLRAATESWLFTRRTRPGTLLGAAGAS